MVEHAAVNRGVAGSSPARGAQDSRLSAVFSFIGIQIPCQQAKGFRESGSDLPVSGLIINPVDNGNEF